MALAYDVARSRRAEAETWKMTKTFLLGFFLGETFLLILFGVVLY
jgi:hypothetical protein